MFIAIFAVFVISCASKPAQASEPAPVPPAESAPPPPPPVSIEEVYEQHRGDLILEGAKTYTVMRTDTLSKITKKNYGSGNGYYFPLIMLASQDVVRNPDLIAPGMKLTIPDLQKNLDDPGARQKIKEFLNEIAGLYDAKGKAVMRDRLRRLAVSL
jgi:hypothetical protein